MSKNAPRSPQIFDASLEEITPDEYGVQKELMETMLKVSRKTYEDSQHATRSVHAKSHGIMKAEFEVLPDLPEVLAQGLFAKPGKYPALMRLSTIPGDILLDKVSTPRGLAIKVLGVEGGRLEGTEDSRNQDFIMVNGKQFNAPSAKVFLANLKLLAATTDKIEGAKELVSGALRGLGKAAGNVGVELPMIRALGGEPANNILGESFFSQLATRYGKYIAKYSVVPVSGNLTALTGAPVNIDSNDDAIRAAVTSFFADQAAVWEFCVQLCADIESMPTEDAATVWDEDISPFVTVARIVAQPQLSWSPARAEAVDDGMGFSVWHGLAAHQPLGSIMRARKLAYDRVQAFRSERNLVPVQEPVSLDVVPD